MTLLTKNPEPRAAALTKNAGGEPLTRREGDLLRLGAICQAALEFWPREKAIAVIRDAERRQFETENYAQSYLNFITEQITAAMRADGATIRFIDDYLFDVTRGQKRPPLGTRIAGVGLRLLGHN